MGKHDSIQSVERAFAALRAISRHGAAVPLAVIASETGLPKSTVSRLLSTMVGIGAVEAAGGGRYSIGPQMRAIVQPAVGIAELTALARPYLRELVDAVGEDAGLAIADGTWVLYVDQVQSSHPVQVQDWSGQRFRAHTTAAGYILLGLLPEADLAEFLTSDLVGPTRFTVTDPVELRSLIDAARAAGFAWTYEAWAEGINGAAAPICNSAGSVVGAINLYGPSYRFPAGNEAAITELLVTTAGQISHHLGGPQ